MTVASGHVQLVDRKRGAQWYVKYRPPGGKQVRKRLGPAWTESGRPAVRVLHPQDVRGRAASDPHGRGSRHSGHSAAPGGKTFDDACSEWLRYVEHDKQRAPSTLSDYRNVVTGHLLPEFGADTRLEGITTDGSTGTASGCWPRASCRAGRSRR